MAKRAKASKSSPQVQLVDVLREVRDEIAALRLVLDSFLLGMIQDDTLVECERCERDLVASEEAFLRLPSGSVLCTTCGLANGLTLLPKPKPDADGGTP